MDINQKKLANGRSSFIYNCKGKTKNFSLPRLGVGTKP